MSFEAKLNAYLDKAKRATTEHSKSFQFLQFVNNIFSEEVEFATDLFPYLENYISTEKGTIAKKGRTDALLGNLIIEFKRNLDTEHLEQAKQQLRKYISIIWREEGQQIRYLLFVSDGIKNRVYRPKLTGEKIKEDTIELEQLDEIDLTTVDPDFAQVWLDRYILYKERQPPTVEKFVDTFGKDSPVYKQAIALLKDQWREVKDQSNIHILFEEWKRYLEIVYGERFGENLFLRHTYLATLSKLMAYTFYSTGAIPAPKEMLKVISGEAFREWGIQNLFEKDFFSWILRAEEEFTVAFCKNLIEHLKSFDLTTLEEDVLKGIYQELVDPEERHDLGEYYTPDWLADTIVRDLDPDKSFLDPACGSGTFLVSTIKYKKEKLGNEGADLLNYILSSVVGVDVHPLAVITSRVNYLLALGELIDTPNREDIFIPVYFADSIKHPEHKISLEGEKVYRFEADRTPLDLPQRIVKPGTLSKVLETVRTIINMDLDQKSSKNQLQTSLPNINLSSGEIKVLLSLAKRLEQFRKEGRDTIWIYILKNIYRPIYLEERKFDYIIGNPPWLSYRYASGEYQQFLKDKIIEQYEIVSGENPELMTQLELATLFFARTSDLYLKEEGVIEFVMPRGTFTADQHSEFRSNKFKPKIKFEEIIDLDQVEPLFNISACVIKGKKGKSTTYPVLGEKLSGTLPSKNASLKEAKEMLQKEKTKFYLNRAGERTFLSNTSLKDMKGSFYKDQFFNGACLYPRNFWFVDIKKHPSFGINPKKPYVETSKRATKYAKGTYKDLNMNGRIPNDFLYAALRGSEIVPFGHLPFLIALLPVKKKTNKFLVLDKKEIKSRGYKELYEWADTVQAEWEKRKKEDTESTAIEWLNRRNKIGRQNPSYRYKVLYIASGTNLSSCVIDLKREKLKKNINGTKIPLQGFLTDITTYYYETNKENVAYYLTAFLNSPNVNKLIKGMQAKGLFGPRHIHKKVLELPIPKFDPQKETHQRLVKIGKNAYNKAQELLPKWTDEYKSIAWIRKGLRGNVSKGIGNISEELVEIAEITKEILS